MMKLSVLGYGWFGSALAKSLLSKGWLVNASCRGADRIKALAEDGVKPFKAVFSADETIYDPCFFDCDVLVIAIPPYGRGGEASSYPIKVEKIKEALLTENVKKVIFISSTGVYADDNREVDENDAPLPGTESGKAILEAENILKSSDAYELAIVRFGGLIGPGRDPGRFFAGKEGVANGLAPVNLIHQRDCVGIVEAIISKNAFGNTFNACANEHPCRMDFYTRAAEISGLPLPAFIAELKQWKVVKSVLLEDILEYKTGPLF